RSWRVVERRPVWKGFPELRRHPTLQERPRIGSLLQRAEIMEETVAQAIVQQVDLGSRRELHALAPGERGKVQGQMARFQDLEIGGHRIAADPQDGGPLGQVYQAA